MEGNNGENLVGVGSEFDVGKVDKEKVRKTARGIGEFYGCNEEVVRRGLSVEVEVVSEDDFLRGIRLFFEGIGVIAEEFEELDDEKKAILDAMGIDPEVKKINRKKRIKELEESVVRWGGCVVKTKDGRDKILIKENSETDKDEMLTHELIHVMMGEDEDGGMGLSSERGEGKRFNEAVTQLLVLRMRYRDLSQREMFNQIRDGRIETGYVEEIHKLLLLLEATTLSEKPLTTKDMASIYFSNDSSSMKRNLLLMRILSRIPENIRGQSEGVYEKYLK